MVVGYHDASANASWNAVHLSSGCARRISPCPHVHAVQYGDVPRIQVGLVVHGFAHLAIDGRFAALAHPSSLSRFVSTTLPDVLLVMLPDRV